jgi:hypothetical protein
MVGRTPETVRKYALWPGGGRADKTSMPRFLLLHSFRGSNVKRSAYVDAAVVRAFDSVASAYAEMDALAEAFNDEAEAARLLICDDRRRPVQRPHRSVH